LFAKAFYLVAMAILPRPSSPLAAWRDFRDFVRAPRKHKIVFAALACVFPAFLLWAMVHDAKVNEEWVPPTIVYVKQWPASRTAAEARAQQAKDLPAELAAKKARDDAAEAKRQAYRRLAEKMGIDVDKQRQ
jgi:hypothetical protein